MGRAVDTLLTKPAGSGTVRSGETAAERPAAPYHAADTLPAEDRDSLPLHGSDTLARCAANSSGDSLRFAAGPLPAAGEIPFRRVAPEEIFGEASIPATAPVPMPPQTRRMTGDPFFQLFLLLLAGIYARFFYLHLGNIRLLFARASRDSFSGKQRIFDDQSNAGYSRFLNAVWGIGLLFAGACALKMGGEWIPSQLPTRSALAVSLTVTAVCLTLTLVQRGALLLAGAVTLTRPFVRQLIHLRRTCFALAVLSIAPVAVLYILCPEGRGTGCLYFIAAESLIFAALYVKESLTLFLSKKIPILHWFLYLCTVECLPISFIALELMRQ